MGTFYAGSGSAQTSISGSLTRLIDEFEPMIRASRVGHRLGIAVPNQTPSDKATFSYFLRSMFVDASGQNSGRRLIGQQVPTAEPGQWKTVTASLMDFGSQAILDQADGYVLTDPESVADMDALGTRLALDHTLDFLDAAASDLLTGDDPWTASEVAASAVWTTTGTDILLDIASALDQHEADVGERLPEGRLALSVGSKTYNGMKHNSSFTSLWGGASSLGGLTLEQLEASLKSIGIERIFVGLDSRYGEYANLYVRPPGDDLASTPNGRLMDSAGIIMPHSGDELISVLEPMALDQRRYGYYAPANAAITVVPEFGVRITGTS